MRKLTLGGAQSLRELIRSALRTSQEQRTLHRLHCALLVAEGRSCYEVARWFGEDPRTVERWVHVLELRGVEGLKEHRAGGRPPKLAAQQLQSLADELREPPHPPECPRQEWSGARLKQHLEASFGIKLSPRQCQRLLRRLARPGPSGRS